MNPNRRQLVSEASFAAALLAAAAALNLLHFALFRDLHHIVLWGLTSLAFLPVSALVVTLFIERLLAARARVQRVEKLNMLVGTFLSTAGNPMLRLFSSWDPEVDTLRRHFGKPGLWQPGQAAARTRLPAHACTVRPDIAGLIQLRTLLANRTDLLLRLLENPNLLGHEQFAELLRAVFHVAEELSFRSEDLADLPESDRNHLAGDIQRAYRCLVHEWVEHMNYLQVSYPYLFSLAARTNPFDPQASAVVR